MRKSLLLATLSVLFLAQYVYATKKVVCYHGTWAVYRPGNGKYTFNDIPTLLCTHYIYAFTGLDASTNEIKLLDPDLDIEQGGFKAAVNLKQRNPNLKVLLGGGGWNEGSKKYSEMASTAASRATFVVSVLKLVQKHRFDGYDLDWEYPARRDSPNPTLDKDNFSRLLKLFHEVFHPLGLLVTAAVSATPSTVDVSYDVPALSQYLDLINVMTYDFHGAFDSFVGHVSPLYSTRRLGPKYADFSINATINGWIERGAAPSKLCLGVPFYGRNNILTDRSNTSPGSAAEAKGSFPGPYTEESGTWGYNEIVELFAKGGWTQEFDEIQKVPYAYSNNIWLSYDNPESITLKVEFAKSLGLGGIMLWSLETDDFHGLSGTKYPLLKAINDALKPHNKPKTTTSRHPHNPREILNERSCTQTGYFRSSSDCTVFFYCKYVYGSYIGYRFNCPSGLFYDTTLLVCNWPDQVTC